ncbi:hypothetical protein [Spirillospora sp. NPDC047279]
MDVLVRKQNVILQAVAAGDLVTVQRPEDMAPVAARLANALDQPLG